MRFWRTGSRYRRLLAEAHRPGADLTNQQFAHLGDFRLEDGGVLNDAVVGYRTAGRLNAARSNVVLVVPWFQGTTRQLARQIGRRKLVDTANYFVIMVDALGNGVSSSPSTSRSQPGEAFPSFTIADVVQTQHRLLTTVLGLRRLHAIVGISMGGMQAFAWTIVHPDFMDKAVSIVGSPQTQPDDRQRWMESVLWVRQPARTRATRMLLQLKPRTVVHELLIKPWNHIRQAEAIMRFDIARGFGGSLERAAMAIRADLMVASTWQDREVNPRPAFDIARLLQAEVLELDGRCGHQAPACERAVLWPAVGRFLDRQGVFTTP